MRKGTKYRKGNAMKVKRFTKLIASESSPDQKKYSESSAVTGVKKDTHQNLCRGLPPFKEERLGAIATALPSHKKQNVMCYLALVKPVQRG